MISYELAKQLKDAGFPQKNNIKCHYRNPETGEQGGGCYAYPTLSELIEACGKYLILVELEDGWGAAKSPTGFNKTFTLGIHKSGDTPEEAVAKLWLELNKK